MNTCGTCKFFGTITEEDEDCGSEYGPYKQCALLQHLNNDDRVRGGVPAAGVVDGSGYFAALCVSEDFGCNQWQPPTRGE